MYKCKRRMNRSSTDSKKRKRKPISPQTENMKCQKALTTNIISIELINPYPNRCRCCEDPSERLADETSFTG
jgi:hypothetical protein